MIYLAVSLVALVGAYVAVVRSQMRRTIAQRYNSVLARWLRLLAPRMQCISLWRTMYLVDPRRPLSAQGLIHELWHIEEQWARWPHSFPFRYLWDVARRGYNGSLFENDARRAAGEPTR